MALDDVSFTVEKGEFVAIVGASGSGKSTLLHLIGGVDKPTKGQVFINDKDIYQMNDDALAIFRRRQIGLVYQFYNLIPILNVEENITLPLELDGRHVDENSLNDILKLLGLENRKKHLPNELSGGQQQRTSIGRAIIKNPDLLLCDEPTGALDYHTSKDILQLIEDVNKKYGNTTIIVTHNDAIKDMADRVIYLHDGRIRENIKNTHKIPAKDLNW